MATPTAMKLAPSQQGRTPAAATPPVSTPFSSQHQHTAFSPLGPRSSPQNVKKSPANSATLMGLTASSSGIPGGSGGGGPGSNAAMNYDSPAAAAIGALGMDLSGLDNVSVGGLAHLGVLGRNDDDERARRLQTVLHLLQQSKGHVSEAGLERLAKSMGLECLWEEAMVGGGDARTLVVAGSALALEIAVANNIVESVSVTFPESRGIVLRHVERADKILLSDLQLQPGESPLIKSLDRFAANLETLAVLDKLSVEPGLNLYEAVAGIYEALDRLFQWDLQQLRNDPANSGRGEDVLAMTAQCARHGRPTMHECGHLGLGIDYWKQMRLVRPARPTTASSASATADSNTVSSETKDTTWRILIGCAPTNSSLMYPPVRVSDKWLSDAIEKQDNLLSLGGGGGGAHPDLDWLEPENTILPSTQQADIGKNDANEAPTTLAGAKLPDVRFNAVFNPPVILPLALWHQINELVGLVPEAEQPVTFDSLLFPVTPSTQHDPSEPRTIRSDKDVYFSSKGSTGKGSEAKKHRHTLFIYKPVYGRVLSELPFSHPSQLVRMLPTLRQYAFLATVLENGFGTSTPKEEPSLALPPTTAGKAYKLPLSNGRAKTSVLSTADDEFERYANGSSRRGDSFPSAATAERLNIDVVLTAHPVPRLQVVFPFRAATADVVLEIEPNAQVHVVSQNIFDDEGAEDMQQEGEDGDEGGEKGAGKGKSRRLYPQDLGRILEVCEDLGVWCEWIRSRCT